MGALLAFVREASAMGEASANLTFDAIWKTVLM